jgi:hypothetical protein
MNISLGGMLGMHKILFTLLGIVLLVSCVSTEYKGTDAIRNPNREKPTTERKLMRPFVPALGFYYPIEQKTEMDSMWLLIKKHIAQNRNYYLAGYGAEPEYEQIEGLFIRELFHDEYHIGRRYLLYLNGKCLLLVLSKEEISELTFAYEEEEADYIFDVVYKMAYLLFNTDEVENNSIPQKNRDINTFL